MTRQANSRLAGIAYLLYIAAVYPGSVLLRRATTGDDRAAQLATMAQHASDVRVATILSMIGGFCALTLAVTLYAITRDRDRDLAMLALTCRVAEGVLGAVGLPATLALLAMVTATGARAPDAVATQTLAAFQFGHTALVGATFFAVGSTIFCWLLLQGRMVPVWLAWVGVVGSAMIMLGLPLQIAHVIASPLTQLMWIPIAVFEVVVAVWLIAKGAAPAIAVAARA